MSRVVAGGPGSKLVAAAAAAADPAAADRKALASKMLALLLSGAGDEDGDTSGHDYVCRNLASAGKLPQLSAVGRVSDHVQRLEHANVFSCLIDHRELTHLRRVLENLKPAPSSRHLVVRHLSFHCERSRDLTRTSPKSCSMLIRPPLGMTVAGHHGNQILGGFLVPTSTRSTSSAIYLRSSR